MRTIDQHHIPEEQVLRPLNEIVTSSTSDINSSTTSPSVRESLETLFPEQKRDEKEMRAIKTILGSLSHDFSDDQRRDIANEIQFLIESWLDDYERKIFKGMTLNELLHEKGGS